MKFQHNSSSTELFLNNLRSKTREYHIKLEQLPISQSLLSEDVCPQDYLTYLKRMYGFIVPFEETYFPSLSSIIPDIELRRKSTLLYNDLQALGLSEEEIHHLPMWDVHHKPNINEALGAMYVIEGSTLGGAVIYKHTHGRLGINYVNGGSYFKSYGINTGVFWKNFMAVFCSVSSSQEIEDELINAATATFKNIHDWFTNA